ncbi:hypothetical protein FRC00_005098 [Tulasnella sp. 408]|nr:hypothetical protein FRC00_005098 [Tulasnella sp. 408]
MNPVLYSGAENTYDVISDAIGTLDSPWEGPQPGIGLYGKLFEGALQQPGPEGLLPVSILKDLLILIRFLEGRIRDPTAPASTRELAKDYCKKCSKIHYTDRYSDAIQTHLEWMKNNVINDRKNPENSPLVESFKIWFRLFPSPDTILEGVDDDDRAFYGGQAEEYHTLYSIAVRALGEIEAAVTTPTAGSSPGKCDITLSQPDLVVERKNQNVDVGSEWWGN